MNAVPFQCDLHASPTARVLNVTLFLLMSALLLCLTWPTGWWWGKIPFLILLVLECWRNEKRLLTRHGRLVVDAEGHWQWCGTTWRVVGKPDWLPCGVLLEMCNQQGKRWRLWLMHDNLPPHAWRSLRACCFLRERTTPS